MKRIGIALSIIVLSVSLSFAEEPQSPCVVDGDKLCAVVTEVHSVYEKVCSLFPSALRLIETLVRVIVPGI